MKEGEGMDFYMGGRNSGKTYTLELAMFGQEVLNEMACFRHVSDGTTAYHIFKLIQKYPRLKTKFDSLKEGESDV